MDNTFAYRPPTAPSPHSGILGQDGGPATRPTSSSGYNQQQQQQQQQQSNYQPQSAVPFAPEPYRPTSSGGPGYQPAYSQPQQDGQWNHPQAQAQGPNSISPVEPNPPSSSIYGAPSQPSHGYGPGFVPMAPHPGSNLRNTRPMTAPSSLAPPYFHSTYSTHHSQPAYHTHQDAYTPQPPATAQPGTFQYQVDSQSAAEFADGQGRDRGFSLPELVGVSNGVAFDETDERRYSATSGDDDPRRRYSATSADGDNSPECSTFFYAPPPTRPSAGAQTYVSNDDLHRPNTGNSAAGPGPLRHSQSNPHFDPYGRPISSHYSDELDNYSPDGVRPGSSHKGEGKVYNFVSQAGHSSKRPRRRFDEIERLYTCDYPGCAKAYGTLNHLNSHKTMQKHGPRATPAQFKELRKAWRDNKKQQAAAIARGDAPPPSLIPAACELKAMGRGRSSSGPSSSSTPDRIRPSTSAGEYHSSVPAFMTSLGQPVATVPAYHSLALPPHQPGAHFGTGELSLDHHSASPNLHLPLPPPGMQPAYASPHVGWNTSFGPSATGFDDSAAYSPHRPVTAPSLYGGAPTFGYAVPAAGPGFGQADLARPAMAENPFGYVAQHTGPIHAPQPRRLSLPVVQPQAGGMDKIGGGFGRGAEPFGGAIQEEVGVVGGEDA